MAAAAAAEIGHACICTGGSSGRFRTETQAAAVAVGQEQRNAQGPEPLHASYVGGRWRCTSTRLRIALVQLMPVLLQVRTAVTAVAVRMEMDVLLHPIQLLMVSETAAALEEAVLSTFRIAGYHSANIQFCNCTLDKRSSATTPSLLRRSRFLSLRRSQFQAGADAALFTTVHILTQLPP
jgi:hypothetical protein